MKRIVLIVILLFVAFLVGLCVGQLFQNSDPASEAAMTAETEKADEAIEALKTPNVTAPTTAVTPKATPENTTATPQPTGSMSQPNTPATDSTAVPTIAPSPRVTATPRPAETSTPIPQQTAPSSSEATVQPETPNPTPTNESGVHEENEGEMMPIV